MAVMVCAYWNSGHRKLSLEFVLFEKIRETL